MPYNPDYHHRHSIRLSNYDYSQNGAYFLTICVQQRKFLFGDVNVDFVQLNEAGQMIKTWWTKLPEKFPQVELDAYVVMPNHVHGIVVLVGADPRVCPNEGAHTGAPLQASSLGNIVQWFKTMTTNDYIRRVKEDHWQPFEGRLWQRNYYEHVIRNESALDDIRSYVQANPLRWAEDDEHPLNARLVTRKKA